MQWHRMEQNHIKGMGCHESVVSGVKRDKKKCITARLHNHGRSSSPSCRASPESLLRPIGLFMSGGTRLSKFNDFRAVLMSGVLDMFPGVRPPQGRWAGLGVTLTKSAKLNCCPGVPKLGKAPPPGVGVNDGKAAYWLGGVDGGKSRVCALVLILAGVGEFAR